MYRIVSEIFEGDKTYPAVTHIFTGETLTQAQGYMRAHMKTDSFFSSCVLRKMFSNFKCREVRRTEKLTPSGWVRR